jgi:hypothetical protein
MRKKLSIKDFILKATLIHNLKYNYSKSEYKGSLKKIEIVCKEHGSFWQLANAHLQGQGCKNCSNKIFSKNYSFTLEEFIQKSNKIHNFKYDYSKTKYIKSNQKVKIICKEHGGFWQIANKHLLGHGCRKCGFLLISEVNKCNINEYILAANKIHNNFYNYSKAEYLGALHKIEIICPKHGSFLQIASAHLQGRGCSICRPLFSKKEENWLAMLKIENDEKHRQVKLKIDKSYIIVDAFNPQTNTVYEFYGDYWHGNPKRFNLLDIDKNNKKSFGELYKETIAREELIKNNGYNLISIWENEWDKGIKNNGITK